MIIQFNSYVFTLCGLVVVGVFIASVIKTNLGIQFKLFSHNYRLSIN